MITTTTETDTRYKIHLQFVDVQSIDIHVFFTMTQKYLF